MRRGERSQSAKMGEKNNNNTSPRGGQKERDRN